MATYRGPDDSAGSGEVLKFVEVSGDTMTGDLTVPNLIVDGLVDSRNIYDDGTKLDTIETDATADQSASEVPNTPAGNISATNVQAAIDELDVEKLPIADNIVKPYDNIAALRAITSAPLVTFATIKGYYTDGDGGAIPGGYYWDASSTETENDGTIIKATAITTGRWKGIYSGTVKLKWFGLKGDKSTDDSTAFQTLLTAITGSDTIIDTQNGDYLIDNPVILTSANKYKVIGNGTFIMGPSFADGQPNADSHVMTFQGGAPRIVSTTNLFYNYWKEASVADVPKGTRILISDDDPANYWDVGGNNYRNSLQTFVDYADVTNGVMNFYPEINFPVALDNSTTKEITDTNIVILVYESDIEVVIESGIKFAGDLNSTTTFARAYAKGILVKRGRFDIKADFTEVSDAIRVEEAICYYQGTMQGGTSLFGGNGIKPIQGSTLYVDNSTITGYRHAVGVGGSTQDGASAYISNSTLGDSRQSYNSSTYPQDEHRALDCHGNSQVLRTVNCNIRGLQVGAGVTSIVNSKIHSQTNPPIELRGQEPADNGELYIDNCDIVLASYFPSNSDALGGGIGTFETSIYFMKDSGFASVAAGWKIGFKNSRFKVADPTNYASGTILYIEPGNVDYDLFVLDNCNFIFTGTNIREIAIDPKVIDGQVHITNNKLNGLAMTVGVRGSVSQDWNTMYVEHNKIMNIDETAGQGYSHGLQISGNTGVSSNNTELHVIDNTVHSFGVTGGITINDSVNEAVICKSNYFKYTGTAGLGYGIRTNVNQNTTSNHIIAHVDGNTVQGAYASTGNTITTGIQINGLAGPAGFYATGNNSVQNATTDITTTGTAITKV